MTAHPLHVELETDRIDLVTQLILRALDTAEVSTAVLRKRNGLYYVTVVESAETPD